MIKEAPQINLCFKISCPPGTRNERSTFNHSRGWCVRSCAEHSENSRKHLHHICWVCRHEYLSTFTNACARTCFNRITSAQKHWQDIYYWFSTLKVRWDLLPSGAITILFVPRNRHQKEHGNLARTIPAISFRWHYLLHVMGCEAKSTNMHTLWSSLVDMYNRNYEYCEPDVIRLKSRLLGVNAGDARSTSWLICCGLLLWTPSWPIRSGLQRHRYTKGLLPLETPSSNLLAIALQYVTRFATSRFVATTFEHHLKLEKTGIIVLRLSTIPCLTWLSRHWDRWSLHCMAKIWFHVIILQLQASAGQDAWDTI